MSIISTHLLCKDFGDQRAVDRLELSVPAQSVYAFLGGNGAGKSTTIRLLLGLLTPSSGQVSLFGQTLSAGNRCSLLKRTGSLVESPSLYCNLSGRDNLRLNQRVLNCAPSNIDHVLRLMGLTDAAERKVGSYSLGMKQRLGLALALLHEPELVILDEPTNGLDPAGIREIRELIRELPKMTGATIFVSSHLLDEVEKMADHVAILHKGQLRFQGRLAELQAKTVLELRGVNTSAIEQTLKQLPFDFQHDLSTNVWKVHVANLEDTANLSSQLAQAGAGLTHLHFQRSGLENVFFLITEGNQEITQNELISNALEGASHV